MAGDIPSIQGVQTRWPELFELAKRKPDYDRRPARTEEENLHILRTAAEFLERTPTMGDIEALRKVGFPIPTGEAYQKRFGGYLQALEQAGLEYSDYQRRYSYTDQELLDELFELCLQAGRLVTRHEFQAKKVTGEKHASLTPILERFDNFDTALEKSGATNHYSVATLQSMVDGRLVSQQSPGHKQFVSELNGGNFAKSLLYIGREASRVRGSRSFVAQIDSNQPSSGFMYFQNFEHGLYVARSRQPQPSPESMIYSVMLPIRLSKRKHSYLIDRDRTIELVANENGRGMQVEHLKSWPSQPASHEKLTGSLQRLSQDALSLVKD